MRMGRRIRRNLEAVVAGGGACRGVSIAPPEGVGARRRRNAVAGDHPSEVRCESGTILSGAEAWDVSSGRKCVARTRGHDLHGVEA